MANPSTSEIDSKEEEAIINIAEDELSENELQINLLIDKIKGYSKNLDKVYSNNTDISKSFDRMKNLDENSKIDIMWEYLISNYKNNFEYMVNNFDKIKKKNMKLLENKTKLKKLKKELKTLKTQIATKEKEYKLNFNRYNEMIFETNLLKNFMMFLMVLLIIPILRLADIINRTLCVVAYSSLVAVGIIYATYLFMSDREKRDNIFYNMFNFEKPDDEDHEPTTTESPEKEESNESSDESTTTETASDESTTTETASDEPTTTETATDESTTTETATDESTTTEAASDESTTTEK
jgi:hypothetical protein